MSAENQLFSGDTIEQLESLVSRTTDQAPAPDMNASEFQCFKLGRGACAPRPARHEDR